MRVRLAGIIAVVVAGVCAALAVAQQPPPTVTVNASPTAVSVAGSVAPGPTRFEAVRSGSDADMSVYVGLLVPGVTMEQFRASVAASDRGSSASLDLVSIQASWSVGRGEDSHASTFTVKPGLTYVLMSEIYAEEDAPPQRAFTTFQSSTTANGAAAPAADATVRMRGLRFRGSRTLPRDGVVRVENRDGSEHIGIAFPLRPGVKAKRVGKVMRGNNERAFGRIVAGPPTEVQNLLSGGDTTNYQEVRFQRKGRYALVCFVDEHNRLGMYRVVSVK